MLLASRRLSMTPISRRSAAILGIILVGASVSGGVGIGLNEAAGGCGNPATVQTLVVIVTNLAINGLLASGYFTLGLTTLFAGPLFLVLTGYTIGRTVQAYGGQGVGLLLPHGVLEVCTWLASAYIGLTTLRRPVTAPAAADRDVEPPRVRRVVAFIVAATILAGVVEYGWTSIYGPELICGN